MKFSHYFLQRPIFSAVLSILILLGGLFTLWLLPVEQYPNMTPPLIQVSASYPGASAETIANSVAAPLETQINGVEDMIYMYSANSPSAGSMALSVFFDIGTDANEALNNVQDRVTLAMSQLPPEVQQSGVTVRKRSTTFLFVVALQSPDERYDDIFMSNYASIYVADEILRLKGVGDAQVIGARDYAMRIWLRPDKMAQLGISTSDVVQAVSAQNYDYPIGTLGSAPTQSPVQLTVPITSLGRLANPKEYEEIILRANNEGATAQIKDIGHVELGAQDYSINGEMNGKSATLIAIYLTYGANALEVAEEVKATLERLSKRFPEGLTYSIPYDTTEFIKASISDVQRTLFEAAVLVALVVFIFLQSVRATLIPVVAMAVSIIGTFIGMYFLDFSLNMLTLFGLVLSIGIVVDDAIVVTENVERNMREKGLSAKEAAFKAMGEVSGPIVAIVLVLCAVFIPVAFLGGIAGQLYKQFAITIAISVIFSGFIALTLSPVLAAFLFKKDRKPSKAAQWFNRGFDRVTHGYTKVAGWLLDHPKTGISAFLAVLLCIGLLYRTIPTSFVPAEDQGYLIAMALLPEGASLDRTEEVTRIIEPIAKENAAIEDFFSMTGFSLLEGLPRTSVGTYFFRLKDWDQRKTAALQAQSVLAELGAKFWAIPQALVLPFNPPAIQGLGTVGGFECWIVNRGAGGVAELEEATKNFIAKSHEYPELTGLSTSVQAQCLQIYADLDRVKARALGVSIQDVYTTLQSLLGSIFVNNFNKYGRVFQVIVQADSPYRTTLDSLNDYYVRSQSGKMVPLKSLVTFHYTQGPNLITRFNGFPAARITGSAAAHASSGQAMQSLEALAAEVLPEDMTFAWSGESYQEKEVGSTSLPILAGAFLLVFLILSALYERWSLPLAILLAAPFGILGALLAVWLRGMENDVYFQIGLITLVALAAKNAILIVEFAMLKRKEGLTVRQAVLEAARLRFRAILMTSFTFIFGVFPLVISSGAGAASRRAVGTGVMGGMIVATLLGLFFVPLFYKLLEKKESPAADKEPPP